LVDIGSYSALKERKRYGCDKVNEDLEYCRSSSWKTCWQWKTRTKGL